MFLSYRNGLVASRTERRSRREGWSRSYCLLFQRRPAIHICLYLAVYSFVIVYSMYTIYSAKREKKETRNQKWRKMCFDFVAVFCCCVGFTLIWARRREVAGLGSRAACPFLNVLLTSIPEALFLYLDCWCLLDSFLLLFSLSLLSLFIYIVVGIAMHFEKWAEVGPPHIGLLRIIREGGWNNIITFFYRAEPWFFFFVLLLYLFTSPHLSQSSVLFGCSRSFSISLFYFRIADLLRSYINIILLTSVSIDPPVIRRWLGHLYLFFYFYALCSRWLSAADGWCYDLDENGKDEEQWHAMT